MWKLQEIYASDFVAGDRFLDDAHLKLLGEKFETSSALIIAENGTFKSTILSLIMSLFSPSKDRFIQTLQSKSDNKSRGDKKMSDYISSGRPAIIMAKFVDKVGTDLLGDKNEHLVIGQLFYKKKNDLNGEIERKFFISDDFNVLSNVRDNWLDIRSEGNGWTEIKNIISQLERTEIYETHVKWTDKITNVGLDHVLMDKQVDFNKTEGGIAKSFQFKSEEQFLEFLLGITSNIRIAQGIHRNLLDSSREHRNVPIIRKRKFATEKLISILGEYNTLSKDWRVNKNSFDQLEVELKNISTYVSKTQVDAQDLKIKKEHEKNILNNNLGELNKTIQSIIGKTFFTEILKLTSEQSALEIGKIKIEKRLKDIFLDKTAINIADKKVKRDNATNEYKAKKEAYEAATEKLSEPKRIVAQKQADYHARLDGLIENHTESKRKNTGELEKIEDSTKSNDKSLKEKSDLIQSKGNKLTELNTKIESAYKYKEILGLKKDELPSEVIISHSQTMSKYSGDKKAIEGSIGKNQNRNKELVESSDKLKESNHKIELETTTLNQWLLAQKKAVDGLRKESLLVTLMDGDAQFNPYSHNLTSKLDERKSAKDEQLSKLSGQVYESKKERARLDKINNLSEDETVTDLISYYRDLGIKSGELRPYIEYLDKLYKGDVSAIAKKVSSNPSRYTGLYANNDVINRVKLIAVPEWLVKPIIISSSSTGDEEIQQYDVISPTNEEIYSQTFLNNKKSELEVSIKELEEKESKLQETVNSYTNLSSRVKQFKESFINEELLKEKEKTLRLNKKTIEVNGLSIEKNNEQIEGLNVSLDTLNTDIGKVTVSITELGNKIEKLNDWLEQNKKLSEWESDSDKLSRELNKLKSEVSQLSELVKNGNIKVSELKDYEIRLKVELENYNNFKNDVPVCDDTGITGVAIKADVSELRDVYNEAKKDLDRIGTEHGVDQLRRDKDEKEKGKTTQERVYNNYIQRINVEIKQEIKQEVIDKWCTELSGTRSKKLIDLDSEQDEFNANKGSNKTTLEINKDDLSKKENEFKEFKTKKNIDDVEFDEILSNKDDYIVILYNLKQEKGNKDNEYESLKAKINTHEKQLNKFITWFNAITNLQTKLEQFDSEKNTTDLPIGVPEGCPNLMLDDDISAWSNNLQTLKSITDEYIKKRNKKYSEVDRSLTRLKDKHNGIRSKLASTELIEHLIDISSEILKCDAETLAENSDDFIGKANNVLGGLNLQIDNADVHLELLVNNLFEHAKGCYQSVQSVVQEKIPHSVPIYHGLQILKSKQKLNFSSNEASYKQALQNWVIDMIDCQKIPEANDRVGHRLGAGMLYKLLKSSGNTNKKEFGFCLLKLDDGKTYTPVDQNLSSGGEGLTSAILLYSVIAQLRSKRYADTQNNRGIGMLILDNPFSIASKASFIQAQIETAESFGLQLVYLSGICDKSIISQFNNRSIMQKSNEWIELSGEKYRKIKVFEQNTREAFIS